MAKKDENKETKTETKMATSPVELLRKITNKTVLGKEFLSVVPKVETVLYTLMGVVNAYETGTTDNGSYVKFKGDFVAEVNHNNKEFRSPACIVPVPMDAVLVNMYDKAVAEMVDANGGMPKGKKASCQFALQIGYKPSDTPTGYEWTVTPLIEMQENDAIASLKSQLKALPAK